jgi:hypothetical protein
MFTEVPWEEMKKEMQMLMEGPFNPQVMLRH